MTKVVKFLRDAEIIKGRKPAAVGTVSKDGKRRKAADGSWKPIKRQRKGKTAPKRKVKSTITVDTVDIDTGKVTSTKEVDYSTFGPKIKGTSGQRRKGPTPKEQNEALKRRIDANVERMRAKNQPKTPSKGKDYEGIDPQFHHYIDKAKANIKSFKEAIRDNPTERHWKMDLQRAEASLPKVIKMTRELSQAVAVETDKSEAFLRRNKLEVGDKVKVKVGTHLTFGDQFGIGTVKMSKDGQVYFAIPANQSSDGKAKRLSTNNLWEKARANAKPIKQKDVVPPNARLAQNFVNAKLDEIQRSMQAEGREVGKGKVVRVDSDAVGNLVVRQGRRKEVIGTQGKTYTELREKVLNAAILLLHIRLQQR